MAISDIPIFSMLKTRMHWHQERQRVLAENVSNSDTPKFRPHDLKPLEFGPKGQPQANGVQLAATDPKHIGASTSRGAFGTQQPNKYDVRPAGNAVNLEEEMMKVASNQMDYQAAISLYSRSMGLFKTAIGRR
jgi:flagellar basal-body rod protein FlgB